MGRTAMTVAALLALLDEIDEQGGPKAARAKTLTLRGPDEGADAVNTHTSNWEARAACATEDTELFFSGHAADVKRARSVCGRCGVRLECLHEALQRETPSTRYGMRGGLTDSERGALPGVPVDRADAIPVLRDLLPPPAVDTPEAAERTDQHMPDTSIPEPAPAAAPTPAPVTGASERLPIGQLLKWAADHPDAGIKDQGAQARVILTGLRHRHAADLEAAALATEAEQLEKRLAELRARQAELTPAKPGVKAGRTPVDYPAPEVRAWAAANGYPCAKGGRIRKPVVDAWRAAVAAAEPKEQVSADA
ncbi:WhiB family transcriptional regulator [Streptomyces sp. NPDC001089]